VIVRLLPQSPDDNAYIAPTDRDRELVRKMPEDVRRTLLAPIEQGMIDKNSVLYFFDDLEKQKVAISAEDFVLLADATACQHQDRLPHFGWGSGLIWTLDCLWSCCSSSCACLKVITFFNAHHEGKKRAVAFRFSVRMDLLQIDNSVCHWIRFIVLQ
jgi:hypothetical protein